MGAIEERNDEVFTGAGDAVCFNLELMLNEL